MTDSPPKTAVAEFWRDRLTTAKKNGKFSDRDRNDAILLPRGPAEELGKEYGLRMRQGPPLPDGKSRMLWPIYLAGADGRKILEGSAFAVAVQRHDTDLAERVLDAMEADVSAYLNRMVS